MSIALITTEDIATEFAKSTKVKDINLLNQLLSEDGTFEIQNEKLDIIEVGRQEFLRWYESKLDTINVTDIAYDQCILCKFGNQVILFNGGEFPRTIKNDSERSKTGLMIDIKDSKIAHIKFCFAFLQTENKYVFECVGEKIKEYLKQGLSFDEAYNKSSGIDESE